MQQKEAPAMNAFLADPSVLIMTLDQAVAWREKLRRQSRRLVVTNGCFDIMHRGHAEYLNLARNHGDAMLVLINSDASVKALKGPTRPLIDEYNRAYMLASLACVDAVVVFDTERCTREFQVLRPDVYVKGGDYRLETLNAEERAALQEADAQFVFIPFVEGFSTTELVRKIKAD